MLIEAIANDGKCTQSSFKVTNPCAQNALTLTGAQADFTYQRADPPVVISPQPYFTPSVTTFQCILTYSLFIQDATGTY